MAFVEISNAQEPIQKVKTGLKTAAKNSYFIFFQK